MSDKATHYVIIKHTRWQFEGAVETDKEYVGTTQLESEAIQVCKQLNETAVNTEDDGTNERSYHEESYEYEMGRNIVGECLPV